MKNTLVIKTRTYGFFSSLFQILDNLKYCELNNLKPLVIYDETFRYNNGLKNAWGQFFEPINDEVVEGDLIDIRSCTNQVELFFMKDFLMMDPFVRNFNLKLWELCDDNNQDSFYKHRKEINDLIVKYLIPSQDIIDEVNNFSIFEWNKTLAVHVRGTDFCYDGNPLELILNETKKLIDQYRYKNIFIASDNKESISLFLNEFDNVFFYDTSLRMHSMEDSKPIFHCVDGSDKIKQGKDVFIESILMSKCDRIVCVNSNVAAFSCYMNPNMYVNMVKKGIGGTGLI